MNKLRLIAILFLLAGCATTEKTAPYEEGKILDLRGDDPIADESIDVSLMMAQQRSLDKVDAPEVTDQAKVAVPEKAPEKPKKVMAEPEYQLDIKVNNPKVQKWIKYYSQKDRERFQRFLNRGARYKQVVQDLFVTNGLPPDLYYLGILESGYIHKAISHAGAVGPWQFMAPTGREYGLKINNYVDERVDPIRATLAASRYLKELYRQKKSWYLALAAYNAGPGRVRRAMRKAKRRGKSQNYWSLTQRRLLPYDTREYIPQFLAMLYIGQNLEKFNFVEQPESHLPPLELVKVPSPVRLNKIAELTGLPKEQLKKYNPNLIKDMTPPGGKTYPLWVLRHQKPTVLAKTSDMTRHRLKGLRATRSIAGYNGGRKIHRVRRGQTLSGIAKRYRVSVSQLRRMNGIRGSHIYVGQKLKVRGVRGGQSSFKKRRTAYHKVRKGQNLGSIARRYGMSLKQIRSINRIKGNRIYAGQKLKVYSRKASGKSRVKKYKIRRGDNLTTIARKFGLSVKQLKKLNGLKSNKIMKGQILRVASK